MLQLFFSFADARELVYGAYSSLSLVQFYCLDIYSSCTQSNKYLKATVGCCSALQEICGRAEPSIV